MYFPDLIGFPYFLFMAVEAKNFTKKTIFEVIVRNFTCFIHIRFSSTRYFLTCFCLNYNELCFIYNNFRTQSVIKRILCIVSAHKF